MSKQFKIVSSIALVSIFSLVLSFAYLIKNSDFSKENIASPEIAIHSVAMFSQIKSKAIAASCGFTLHGSSDEYTSCNFACPSGLIITGRSQCGGICQQDPSRLCPVCSNGAVNPTACDRCGAGSTWNGTRCICNNLASNSPSCDICPTGLLMQNNFCVCTNGATNPMACDICPVGSTMTNGTCTCNNSADIFSQCSRCRAGQVFDNNGVCRDACNTTNVCGQTKQGYLSGGRCNISTASGEDPNASCIIDLNVTTNSVNPNGSVEFSWSLANLPAGVRSVCGFVDLTTPTPRPIPGLQNLSPQTDRIRINNIQVSTRFCLVCQFSNLTTGAILGEAAKHQWVRVIRVGEN